MCVCGNPLDSQLSFADLDFNLSRPLSCVRLYLPKGDHLLRSVAVKIGLLRSVRIGAVSADNVEVSFIADAELSGNRLLGMSFLQRFKMTIDDAANELVLMAK